ncbi:hypothetical protein SPRG_04553 [Saprolegnia parasitica CBS 223.65]|uniref:Uncharacterized protein n=1 Tax=Saprolegnia parasitica (strain CBS 223.65) TaxID=695850 RepID=A0A067CV58_SAPPC|nr:hypothetical protein SPRG_04553 [Saprolegnia parasitica CBS 223.65]KDO30652.1 hypothetical protein SPRG_04553 [Saprolegnia parasitica CBS 223.65]|eukprot:XP_012198862.1 hypothetical protein SPRG_04553 [Saprolegnia parasitica CBS 223.65]
MWKAFAKNLLGTCVLDEMAWTSCALSASQVTGMAPALREWITRGIRKISFVDCAFQEDHLCALAAAIARTTSRVGVRIRIEDKVQRFKNTTYILLGQALASCRGVSIELPPVLGNNWRDELGTIDNLAFDHLMVDGRPRLVLASVA